MALWVGRFCRDSNVVPWFSLSTSGHLHDALTGLVPFYPKLLIFVVLIIWAAATIPPRMVAVGFSVVMNAYQVEGRYELMSRWSILGMTTAITVATLGRYWIGSVSSLIIKSFSWDCRGVD
jgi:hypothetical protein